MNVYENGSLSEKLSTNAYPGRGIVMGVSPDGKKVYYSDYKANGDLETNELDETCVIKVVEIKKDSFGKTEVYDSNTSGAIIANEDGSLIYFKNYNDGKVDLYYNKKCR